MDKKKKREIAEWTVILAVIATLYFTGWHTEVIATLQRGVLATGIVSPARPSEVQSLQPSDYDFKLLDLQERTTSFSSFKGKTVFVNLWATWCPPCIAEMPEIQSLFEKTASERVVFVMISLDEDKEKARKFVERKGYTFPVFIPASGLPAAFHSRSIPTTLVVSPEGKIVVRQEGMASYDTETFRKLLLNL